MPRGGKRLGAGNQTKWKRSANANETKLIRVPIVLADDILVLAHQLDRGEITLGDDSKAKLDKICTVISDYEAESAKSALAFPRSRDWTKCRKMLKDLQSITQK
jgi:hypothetical protein